MHESTSSRDGPAHYQVQVAGTISERIFDFWPVAVIVIGLKIVYDSLRKND